MCDEAVRFNWWGFNAAYTYNSNTSTWCCATDNQCVCLEMFYRTYIIFSSYIKLTKVGFSPLPFGQLNEQGLLIESKESTSSPNISPTLSNIPSMFPASPSCNISSRRSREFPWVGLRICHNTNTTTTDLVPVMFLFFTYAKSSACCYWYVYRLRLNKCWDLNWIFHWNETFVWEGI